MKQLKPIYVFFSLLFICAVLQGAAFADGSLLMNADFSAPELPDGWDIVAYEAKNYSGYTQNGALVIASAAENDVRRIRSTAFRRRFPPRAFTADAA